MLPCGRDESRLLPPCSRGRCCSQRYGSRSSHRHRPRSSIWPSGCRRPGGRRSGSIGEPPCGRCGRWSIAGVDRFRCRSPWRRNRWQALIGRTDLQRSISWLIAILNESAASGFVAFALLALSFPDGRVRSHHWRWLPPVLMVCAAWIRPRCVRVDPSSVAALGRRIGQIPFALDLAGFIAFLLVLGLTLACAVSLVLRFRHSDRVQRQQISGWPWPGSASLCTRRSACSRSRSGDGRNGSALSLLPSPPSRSRSSPGSRFASRPLRRGSGACGDGYLGADLDRVDRDLRGEFIDRRPRTGPWITVGGRGGHDDLGARAHADSGASATCG